MGTSQLNTVMMLATGDPALVNSPRLADIIGEFNRIATADRASRDHRWLLKILYTTRALDTCLREIIKHKRWNSQNDEYGLGYYLKVLARNGALNEQLRRSYQKDVVDLRNRYMHSAGANPDKLVADRILSEMLACLSAVLLSI